MALDFIDGTRIGYLRKMAPSTTDPCPAPSGPLKSMWRKLVRTGHAESSGLGTNERFRRTPEGDAALADFDRHLSDPQRNVITAIGRGRSFLEVSAMKGTTAALASGLVHFPVGADNLKLDRDAERLLDLLERWRLSGTGRPVSPPASGDLPPQDGCRGP